MSERLDCRCGWSVHPGLDCDFCGTSAAEVIRYAEQQGHQVVLHLVGG